MASRIEKTLLCSGITSNGLWAELHFCYSKDDGHWFRLTFANVSTGRIIPSQTKEYDKEETALEQFTKATQCS